MSAGSRSQAQKVISLYRQILKLGKSWEAKDPSLTAIQSNEILTEARDKFRANKNTSTHLDRSTESSSVKEKSRSTGFTFDSFNEYETDFCRKFFSGTKITDDLIRYVANKDSLAKAQLILCHSIFDSYPLRQSYRRSVLKAFTRQLELISIEVSDNIYSALADSMCDTQEFSYRLYLCADGSSLLCIVSESNQQLCYGTTGLSIWQASCDLAYFCSFFDFSGVVVLELGAGCGLAGISVACSYPSTVVLSDYDPKVLERLALNVELIGKKPYGASNVTVQNIDWTAFEIATLKQLPDIILAADVVYDRALLPHLCNVIYSILKVKPTATAIIASTLRDPETLQAFRHCLDDVGLTTDERASYQHGCFQIDGESIASPTSFPFFSTLDSPTMFYQVKLRS